MLYHNDQRRRRVRGPNILQRNTLAIAATIFSPTLGFVVLFDGFAAAFHSNHHQNTRHDFGIDNAFFRRQSSNLLRPKTLLLGARTDLGPFLQPTNTSSSTKKARISKAELTMQEMKWLMIRLCACMGFALLLVSWEGVSLSHPMRIENSIARTRSPSWGEVTVRGMAFGTLERSALARDDSSDLEPSDTLDLPSYNEVMLQHREKRVPIWQQMDERRGKTTRQDVEESVMQIQMALLKLQECKTLVQDYKWDEVGKVLNQQNFRTPVESSCYLLEQADDFLPPEARQVVGFDWGSCAWRHCGALADAQEALDEIEHLLGVLEPFECMFCLDIIERSLRDILSVTAEFQSKELQSRIPAYAPLQRMSDVNQDNLDGFDLDFMKTLNELKNLEL
ncbi:hypothetical protein IV203_010070 [Nitzschia inconspicua]|uniref:Uncharacterized protein n=1 Tax=Nitzschia inconspicua TaxID=303405 RepID=A0A9K3PKH1_9STRA|nr:hypothetical protein IV203_010070 [Nitzschia inconspicua]